jgi:hypothetical protein
MIVSIWTYRGETDLQFMCEMSAVAVKLTEIFDFEVDPSCDRQSKFDRCVRLLAGGISDV